MKYASVKFVCQMQTAGNFPAYAGSMLRGMLGSSLRRAVCMTQKAECSQCMLSATCVFPRLFVAAATPAGDGMAPMTPPPFCIEPPRDKKCRYLPGERFAFTLKLFSFAVEYLPYFVHAFSLAGQRGRVRDVEGRQGQFHVVDVLQNDISVYDAQAERLHALSPESLDFPALRPTAENGFFDLFLLTPLRFKQKNHLAAALPFSQLLHLILRRSKGLSALEKTIFHLPGEEFSFMKRAAECIHIAESFLTWQDWTRYSGRQNTVMKLGGLVGRIRYAGPVSVFSEYLDFACRVHIGKQTSFGLGHLAVQHGMP